MAVLGGMVGCSPRDPASTTQTIGPAGGRMFSNDPVSSTKMASIVGATRAETTSGILIDADAKTVSVPFDHLGTFQVVGTK